ncbi:PXA domain-containing protein [Aspergillus granulosus]|uniref:PXA domain-containing protein n=1 Tax=Aspergillus granulosus TaxID=176169 RepID=A0ABR4H6T4_9EURO
MDVSDDVSPQPQSDQLALPASKDATTKDDNINSLPKANNRDIINMKELVDLVLQFLSTCSNEMLLFVLALLMGATYILLGRLGLIIIGITLGIALHASWDHSGNPPLESQSSSRKQLSLHVTHRLLDWQNNRRAKHDPKLNDEGEHMTEEASDVGFDSSSYGPATASALQSIVDAVVRDYVNYWYKPILPSESTFPISCQRTMTGFINSLSSHLCRKRTADTFLEFLTNSSSMIIVFLNELSTAFEIAGPAATAEDAILRYLESNPDSSLANLVERQQQQRKLKMISDDILSRFLDHSAYQCTPLRTFLREILAGVALESTIVNMSRPEFINGWITYLFSEGESEIMNAIDAGVEGARTQGITSARVSGEHARLASVPVEDYIAEPDPPAEAPIRVSNEPDQAMEEAMLEAKRLSAMIAAQVSREESDRNQACEEGGTEMRSSDARSSLESSAIGGAEHIQKFEPSKRSGSLSSPLHSREPHSENSDVSPAFNLHCASIMVDDSMDSGEKTLLRVKPSSSYLIQIETRSGRSTGWMVFRKYADFESIHETLGTISRLNQLRFGDSHPVVPPWKGQTRQALARDLERYLHDALQLEPLAESVTMRRFLDKDGGLGAEPADSSTKPGFVFLGQTAFENVGKGVLGGGKAVFEGVSGGGKAVFEGVTGVFGGASKKTPAAAGSKNGNRISGSGLQKDSPPPALDNLRESGGLRLGSDAMDGALSSRMPEPKYTPSSPSPSEAATQSSDTPVRTPGSEENVVDESTSQGSSEFISMAKTELPGEKESKETTVAGSRASLEKPAGRKAQSSPITADETRMAVELIFAVINELYSLSSAWNIRRTLLNAAKSYILRPGNPSLETIRNLLQESMIDSHSSDDAISVYLTKLRENALPTAEELSAWPPPISESEQARQREAARRILVQKGLPQAITSVMGAVASREALGKIFDSLQIEAVARGFVFSIFLQALRAVAL